MQTTQHRRPETSGSRLFIRQLSSNFRLSVSRMGAAMNRRRRPVTIGLALLLIIGSTAVWSRPSLIKWFESPVIAKATGDTQPGQPWTRMPRVARRGNPAMLSSAAASMFLTAPTNLRVTATASQSISLAWNAPINGSFANYRIERSTSFTGSPEFVTNVAAGTTTFTNNSLPTGVHSYLYRVRTVNIFGSMSAPSNLAMGTTINFEDATLTAGVTEIKAQHIYDLRDTVNAVRALVPSMGAGSWARGTLGGQIVKAEEINELRDQLDDALEALQIPVSGYTDSPLQIGADGTPIRKVHIEQLRTRSTIGKSNSSGPADNYVDSTTARLDPLNRTGGGGDDPLSRNFNWSVPLVSLPGRSGLDLGLSLSYNSLATWTKSGSVISFDDDYGRPSPGFRLGFPVIEEMYYNAQAAKNSFLLITPSGARVELRQVGTSGLYQAVDSSYLLLDATSDPMVLRTTDGTQLLYQWKTTNYECTKIQDRNGNYITISYNTAGRISTVTDTLNREITFNYSGSDLTSITQTWGSSTTHYWARFTYANKTINTNFSGLTVWPANNTTIRALTQVKFADDTYFEFDYTSWGQVWKISQYTNESTPTLLNYRSYNLPADTSGAAQTDCPRFTERYDWAKYWNRDTNGTEQAVTTSFAAPSSVTIPNTSQTGLLAQVTRTADETYQKLYYGSSSGSPAWQHGLIRRTETYASSTVQRTVTTAWTQDDTNATYQINPRATETIVSDANNSARTTVSYDATTLSDGTTINLPEDTIEYEANGSTQLRRTHVEYKEVTTDYLNANRRVIGLVSERTLYGGPSGSETLMSKVSYAYDGSGSIQNNDAPVQHDTAYSSSLVAGRGNVSSVTRHNVVSTSLSTTSTIKYNTAGSVVKTIDAEASTHETEIAYADSFSDNGNSRNTLAYPTTVTDADDFESTTKYNFDFGGVTRKQTPLPNANQTAPAQILTYDSIGRVSQVTNSINSAYTSYEYGPNFVQTRSTVNTANNEAYSLKVFDGAGRLIASAGNHPGSSGGYSAQRTTYDAMGRAIDVSNPTETSLSSISTSLVNPYAWAAVGDDYTTGAWPSTQQTYDWKGRPLVTTNPDNTTKSAVYSGCGCAGGEVVTLTNEVGRVQSIYSDVLGRPLKTEIMNGSSIYSTTRNTYNARDQITLIREYQGNDQSSTYQDTTMSYDGYGRLSTKHLPEQQVDSNNSSSTDHTTWTYNNDDTIASVTDARGVTATYSYNLRHLLTGIDYPTSLPTGVSATTDVSFTYDAAGNRLSMTDGTGSTAYEYDQLSRMINETKTFTGLSGSFTLAYQYNLANQPISVTDQHSSVSFSTGYDNAGRVSSVSGVGYNSTSTQFVSSASYRAWGALKSSSYGNSTSLTLGYNSRGFITSFSSVNMGTNYQYYADGQVKFAQDSTNLSPVRDRAFSYDHAGRLAEAYSGSEARNFINSTSYAADGPFRQSYSYDAWDNMTNQDWRLWSRNGETAATYGVTNRNSVWSYDPDGNLLSRGDGAQYGYDAAGSGVSQTQQTSFYDTENLGTMNLTFTNDVGLDGDDDLVHLAKTQTSSFNGNTPTSYTEHVYNLRSTVLGGRVISEYNGSGTWKVSYVYFGGERIGTQVSYAGEAYSSWRYVDPVTGDEGGSILDPQGVDVGHEDTFPPDGSGDLGLLVSGGDPVKGAARTIPLESGGAQCVLDGIRMDCGFVRGETSVACPNNDCGPQVMEKHDQRTGAFLGHVLSQPFQAFADGWSAFLPPGAIYDGGGRWSIPTGGKAGKLKKERRDRPEDGNYGMRFNHATPLPQNPAQTKQPATDPQCDARIAAIFGGPGAVAATVYEPPGVDVGPGNNRYRYDHLAGQGVFHIYTDANGSDKVTGLFIPPGGRKVSGGEYDNHGDTENFFRYSYTSGPYKGVQIALVHVGGTHGGEEGGQYLGNFHGEKNAMGSIRIGNIAGLGGGGDGYNHTHVKVYLNGKLTDPRKVFCK